MGRTVMFKKKDEEPELKHWNCTVTYEVDIYNIPAISREAFIEVIKNDFKQQHNITLDDAEIRQIKEVSANTVELKKE